MKNRTSTFLRPAVITTAIVGALALCTWLSDYLLDVILSSPHSFGSLEISPHGHRQDGYLTHHWDSIAIKKGENTFILRNTDLDITLFQENRNIQLQAGEVNVNISSAGPPKEKNVETDSSPPSLPEQVKFYVPVSIGVGKLTVDVDSSKHWEAKDISLKSEGSTKARFSADSIKGDFVKHPAKVGVSLDFQSDQIKMKGKVVAGPDSIAVDATTSKKNLAAVSTTTSLDVKKVEDWLPVKIPKGAPTIGKLHVQTKASLHPKTGKPNYDVTIKTRIGEFWPLMPLNATIRVKGDQKRFHSDVLLKNDEGGTIHLTADMDTKLNGTASGKVEKMSALFGPQMMPLDMTIHSAEKKGNKITAKVETRQGSVVEANIDLDSDIPVTYTGDMSPLEPWALDWTKGELVLKDRFKVYGTVFDGKTRIFVKIPNVEYAYQMKADSLQTVLLIDKHGIDFSKGIIYTPKETFDFTGDVVWDEPAPHTSWNVTQRHGGSARAYVTIMDSITIDVSADQVEISTIPFAKTKLNEKLNGKVTGRWTQNFDTNVGKADVSMDGYFDPYNLKGSISARQNGDTIFIDKAEAIQSQNKVQGEAIFILPNDSNPDFKPTGVLPIQVIHAWAASEKFNIPLLLDPINDTTFTSGFINGDIAYEEKIGLQGNIEFTDIEFSKIPPYLFNIKKMNLFAEGSKVELNAYLGIGGGGWTGTTQVTLDNVFNDKRHLSLSHSTDNGGNLWAEGFIDTALVFTGNINMNGSWFIPGTVSEIKKTDLQIALTANIREGINGITADLQTDSTFYQPPKLNYMFPLRARGHLEKGILNITEASTQNDSAETISGTLQFDLNNMQLQGIDLQSEKYTIRTKHHTLLLENISSHMEDNSDALILSTELASIQYLFNHESFGDAEVLGQGDIKFVIPHSIDGFIRNKSIEGNITIDKAVYKKDLEIEVTPSSMDKILAMLNNAIARLRKTESKEAKISAASPINLSVHVMDTQKDSIEILSPFAAFPFTFDIWVLGNTNRPLLRGDVTNANAGFIGVKDVYNFDLNYFRISWSDVPWQKGVLDVSSSQELPYCTETDDNQNETCPINLDIQGTLTNPQATPNSNCGRESSSAAIYYNIFLGCIADDTDENTDWNKLAGKAIGKFLSSTANKTLGGEYIGDIDMKVMLFNSNTSNDRDSSYFKVPVSLDRWVKDLSLIFGYTQDQSENPTYDQALQFGVNYTLPVFREKEYSHKNHINPTLSLSGLLVSKQYLTNTGTEGNENRIEKNVGVNYTYRFWNPCLLGIGHCESIAPPRDSTLAKQPTKTGAKQ